MSVAALTLPLAFPPVHPNGHHLSVLHTNPASNFNGRQLQDGKYLGNFTPIQILNLPDQAAS